jgi:hypothetical protein
MSDKDIEKIVRMHFDENQPAGECPDSETLSAFAEGQLAGDEEDQIAEHLAYCSVCREVLVNLKSIKDEESGVKAVKAPYKKYIYVAASIAAAVIITFASIAFFDNDQRSTVATAEENTASVAQGFSDEGSFERLLINFGYHYYKYLNKKSYDLTTYIEQINSETECRLSITGEDVKFNNSKCRRVFEIGALAATLDNVGVSTLSVLLKNRDEVCSELSYDSGPLSALTNELYSTICIGDIAEIDSLEVKKAAKKIVLYGQD